MRFVHDSQRVTVPSGGVVDVVMALQDRDFRELTIWGTPMSTRAAGDGSTPAVRDFSTRVFFGPTAQGGAPTTRVDDEEYVIYDPGDTCRIWPANNPTSNLSGSSRQRAAGFPVTVRITNNNQLRQSNQPVNITGVEITAVDPATPTGTGTMTFTAAGTLLDWQAPGAGAPGAAQNVGAGGSFTLDGGDGTTIDVDVVALNLPAGDESDEILISEDIGDVLVINVLFTAMTIDQG
jgi:hypothetical protein